jgi:hypothetical protein
MMAAKSHPERTAGASYPGTDVPDNFAFAEPF